METKQLVEFITNAIIEKKGSDISILEVSGLTNFTDYFILCTANSDTQSKAMADYILEQTRKVNELPINKEGLTNCNWVLIDFVDVVVHIFLAEPRNFYDLEGLWGDAKITRLENPVES